MLAQLPTGPSNTPVRSAADLAIGLGVVILLYVIVAWHVHRDRKRHRQ